MAIFKGTRTFIHVDRERHELRLYERAPFRSRFRLTRKFKIAVGAIGHRTPHGMYVVKAKALDPWWEAPKSDWVPEEMKGQKFPPGDPGNPLTGAFIAIWNGIGIHGTRDLASLGTDASHGCIRMATEDVLELYPQVPVGCPVYIR